MTNYILYEDFESFFQYRAYDILSNGQYKKKLTQCKENGDFWALEMHTKQNKVHQIIKRIQGRVHVLGKTPLGMASKNVINCAQPPIRIFLGYSTCFITGLQSDKCLDLSKNGKKIQDIHIHPRFAFFFLFLWYICKLEYVIRACAKYWVESGCGKDCVNDLDAYYEKYMCENKDLCKGLYDIFEKAMSYVQKSLDLYDEEFLLQPVLDPPAIFWEKNKKARVSQE